MIGVYDLHSKMPEVATTSAVTSTTAIHTLQVEGYQTLSSQTIVYLLTNYGSWRR